jgi:arsenite-transporting ATPase
VLVQDSVVMVRDLFRNEGSTEFVIATIPTVLGVSESSRLLKALRKEKVPCTRIVVNQVGRFLLVRLKMSYFSFPGSV